MVISTKKIVPKTTTINDIIMLMLVEQEYKLLIMEMGIEDVI